ncbi:MAG: hypothetical protein ACP5QR_01200 [Rhizomicrobium sp.]
MMVATAFGCLALFFYMRTVMGAGLAALAVAGFAVFLTLLMAVLVYALPKPSLLGTMFPAEADLVGRLGEAFQLGRNLGEEGQSLLRSKLSNVTLAAIGAGILLGYSPRLRRAIFSFLKRN